ncbi:hypothetical protein BRC66_05295 [Halobacteriales archaeon QH_2_66_30]|nr:MAG: hypothetical protein BRC66_05295 [Halobacteriales archaeon QH_2_66_30]PSQ49885.1 MAG: hypothetical protein BRD19_02555 [Halobacteriales archaeon SW_7_65_23]
MIEADPSMRAGRNAFLALIVALIAAYVYRFAIQGADDDLLFALWILGAAVYVASQTYYQRQAPGDDGDDGQSGDGSSQAGAEGSDDAAEE